MSNDTAQTATGSTARERVQRWVVGGGADLRRMDVAGLLDDLDEITAERDRLLAQHAASADLYVALDGHDQLTVWHGKAGDWSPVAALSKFQIAGAVQDEVWLALTGHLPTEPGGDALTAGLPVGVDSEAGQ